MLTISQWYSFFLVSQLSLFIFPIVSGVVIFVLGFIGRPLGGIIFGHIGDKISRKTALFLTSLLLILSSILVIILYSCYSVLAFRLFQGLSLGGEWGGASTVLIESYSSSRYRGFIASIVQLSVPIAIILSSTTIFVLTLINLSLWKFSLIPIILLTLLSTYLIKDVSISGMHISKKLPLIEAIKHDWRNILKGIGIKISESAIFYIFTSYIFSKNPSASTLVTLSISLQLFMIPLFGYLSDIIGRRKVIIIGVLLIIPGAILFPGLAGELILSLSDSALYAPQSAILTEIFNRKYRFTASNFSYQVASLIGGALVPSVLRLTNYPVVLVVLPYVIITLVSVILVKETKGREV
ncbi:MFS transporter [Acidianus sp. HS-5]|uniref:MFS transporter n=1 Tax=Acidianus sp. HS-5 TaxID=2886040 RepID=UPI003211C9C6